MSFIHFQIFKVTKKIIAPSTALNAPKSPIFKKKVKYGLILNSKKARLSTKLIPIVHELSMGSKDFGVIVLEVLAV